jgi:endonuclease/exonuclease/phosphatase family metal-dependent hydrolase
MTFNIRYDEVSDGRHVWRNRRDLAIATIRARNPDLLGLQEPTEGQWADLAAALPGWSRFGEPEVDAYDAAPQGGFIRTARFGVRDRGLFWLSDTPSEPNSVSWDNDWGARACGWVRLHDRRAHREIVFACTHFDTNAGAWLPSAAVLHAELDKVAGALPIVVVGDFNCAAGSDAHRYLLSEAGYRDAWSEAGHADEGVLTFNGFTSRTHLTDDHDALKQWLEAPPPGARSFDAKASPIRVGGNNRIDWILVRGPLAVRSAIIDYRDDDGLLPSDHYPVVSRLEYAS